MKREPSRIKLAVVLLAAFVPRASEPARAKPAAERREVQGHGVWFEKWVRDTFFDGYQPASYTQQWDIPASANTRHGGIPVNPKANKWKAPIDLGDALRQFQIAEPFLLIIGYWKQEGSKKRLVNIVPARVEPQMWRELWGGLTLADLQRLNAVVKDKSLSIEEARAKARKMKAEPPFSHSLISLNPKINKSQRRLQCSLRFGRVFGLLAPDADPSEQERPSLWGVSAPPPLESPPRVVREK